MNKECFIIKLVLSLSMKRIHYKIEKKNIEIDSVICGTSH